MDGARCGLARRPLLIRRGWLPTGPGTSEGWAPSSSLERLDKSESSGSAIGKASGGTGPWSGGTLEEQLQPDSLLTTTNREDFRVVVEAELGGGAAPHGLARGCQALSSYWTGRFYCLGR